MEAVSPPLTVIMILGTYLRSLGNTRPDVIGRRACQWECHAGYVYGSIKGKKGTCKDALKHVDEGAR